MNLYRYVGGNPLDGLDPGGLEEGDTIDTDGLYRRCRSTLVRREFAVPAALRQFLSLIGLPDVEVNGRFYAKFKRCEKCCPNGTWKPTVAGSIRTSLYAKGVTGKKELEYVTFEYGVYFRAGGAGSFAYMYDGCVGTTSGSGCFTIFVEGGLIGQVEVKGGWVNVGKSCYEEVLT